MKQAYKKYFPKAFIAATALFFSAATFAEAGQKPETDNPVVITLIIVAGALLLAIMLLGYVLINVAGFYRDKVRNKLANQNTGLKTLAIISFALFSSSALKAQDATAEAVEKVSTPIINGVSDTSFYALISVIAIELVILLLMVYFIKFFITKEKPVVEVAETDEAKPSKLKLIWQKMNNFRPQSEEKDVMLDHNYDGIRELDNNLPNWWKWGFYFTILFGCVYLYRYHVAHSAPLSQQEFQIAMAQAEEQKEAYLKKTASQVDENTVSILTDAAAIQEGGKIFAASCSPCHGDKGQGIVGPNLTDDYWLHGGSIHDVFKTIKYGYPEKGMKSWKDDFSPVQISKIANYVKSLHGTNPPNAKEPQGELFKDNNAASAKDTSNTANKKITASAAVAKEAAL